MRRQMRNKRLARLTGVGAIALAATALTVPAWAQSGRPRAAKREGERSENHAHTRP
jgi:predicted ATPase